MNEERKTASREDAWRVEMQQWMKVVVVVVGGCLLEGEAAREDRAEDESRTDKQTGGYIWKEEREEKRGEKQKEDTE